MQNLFDCPCCNDAYKIVLDNEILLHQCAAICHCIKNKISLDNSLRILNSLNRSTGCYDCKINSQNELNSYIINTHNFTWERFFEFYRIAFPVISSFNFFQNNIEENNSKNGESEKKIFFDETKNLKKKILSRVKNSSGNACLIRIIIDLLISGVIPTDKLIFEKIDFYKDKCFSQYCYDMNVDVCEDYLAKCNSNQTIIIHTLMNIHSKEFNQIMQKEFKKINKDNTEETEKLKREIYDNFRRKSELLNLTVDEENVTMYEK